MSSIHGDEKISRRIKVKSYSDYHKYKTILKEDFKHICGYCGKNALIFKEDFQIDHFVPKKVDKSRINDYSNLVFSCRVCNRRKWDFWPTNDRTKPNDGKEGFVDPVTDEFQTHLSRDSNGDIVANTDVGKYMFDIFKFNVRPIRMTWQVMELYKKERELAKKIESKNGDGEFEDYKEYYKISESIKKILGFLYKMR